MIHTLIRYKPDSELQAFAEKLAPQMQLMIAQALSTPALDGEVRPDQVVVWCVEGNAADVNTRGLEIMIWAPDVPSRKRNLEERRAMVNNSICMFRTAHNQHASGSVSILLQPIAHSIF